MGAGLGNSGPVFSQLAVRVLGIEPSKSDNSKTSTKELSAILLSNDFVHSLF